MAVIWVAPAFRASRNAMKKNSKSPTSTPMAVPGTMCRNANRVGNSYTACNRPTVISRSATLSNIKPKKALTSPGAAQR